MNESLLKIADDIRQSCNFINKSDEYLYGISKSIYLYLYEVEKKSNYLIRLCALIVKKNKKTTSEVLEYSKKALVETQHPDAVVYYCKALVLNSDASDIVSGFSELKGIDWKDTDVRSVVGIFEACFYYGLGDYKAYTEIIKKFNNEKSPKFNPYISIPVSSVYGKETIDIEPVVNDVIGSVRTELPGGTPDYCISVSCNKKYFDDYGSYLISSLQRLADNFYCHISITDEVGFSIEDARFKIVNQNIGLVCNVGPVSSSLRFIHALDLLDAVKVPVIVLDFDCVILDSPKPLLRLEGADVGLRILENTLPWERYTGGMSIYLDNKESREILKGVRQYLMETISDDREQWWVDQNALEIAVRTCRLKYDVRIKNIFREIPRYIYIPTGTKEGKLMQMDRVLNN
ncbi:hypothetical protein [Pseudomonas sp. SCB32]|uniref:hypothetical protein n=1 Tax=Pseudomonas sp. SCB32 TaxID=2653853 RepID=UPI00126487A3|nr:hypothetical protein [Pseudomonas sp. SCB32]